MYPMGVFSRRDSGAVVAGARSRSRAGRLAGGSMAGDSLGEQARRGVSRRGFLVGAGTGAAAAAAVTTGIVGLGAAEAQTLPHTAPELGRATVRLRVNGVPQTVEVEHRHTLLEVLR